jgi:hypothetical protein
MIHTVSARLAAALVATIAGAASWEHIASVALMSGERPWVAYSLPAAIDGLILVGVAALLEDKRSGRVGRLSARVAIVAGVLATLAANLASAEPSVTARLVAVAAPVSFLLSVEVLTRTGRAKTPDSAGVFIPDSAGITRRKPVTSGKGVSANLSHDQGTPPARVRTKPPRKPTADRVAAAVARTPAATPAELAARLRLSERTVQRHLPGEVRDSYAPRLGQNGIYAPAPPVEVASPNGGPS